MRIGVNKPPMWYGTVDAFIDLLSGRSVEATIALREAADPQPTGEAWERALALREMSSSGAALQRIRPGTFLS